MGCPTWEFGVEVHGVRLLAEVCRECGVLPSPEDSAQALACYLKKLWRCAGCGEPFNLESLNLVHQHAPDVWMGRIAGVLDMVDVPGAAEFPVRAHPACSRGPFPHVDRAYGRSFIAERRRGMWTIPRDTESRQGREPLALPPQFIGQFASRLKQGTFIEVPSDWIQVTAEMVGFVSPVAGERCLRIYERSCWAGTRSLMLAYGSPEPFDVRPIPHQNGLVNLPLDLLSELGIQQKVHVCGSVHWFEVWPEDAWRAAIQPVSSGPSLWRS